MHFPHLSLVDDWLEEETAMALDSHCDTAPVTETTIVEGTNFVKNAK